MSAVQRLDLPQRPEISSKRDEVDALERWTLRTEVNTLKKLTMIPKPRAAMRKRSLRLFSHALMFMGATAALSIPGRAQQTENDTPTLSITARLVVLDIVVTDRKGKPVPGLKADDFQILEDKQPQTIKHFEAFDQQSVPTANSRTPEERADAPKIIIVLDELNTPWDERSFAHSEVDHYLKAQPVELSNETSAFYVDDYGYHPIASYTRDRDALLRAIDAHRPGLPTSLSRGDGDVLIGRSFSLLQQISIATRGEAGRKAVLWIGRGFPAVDLTSLSPVDQERMQTAINYTSNLLLDSRITVFKVDPSPLTTQPPSVDFDDDGNAIVSAIPTQDPLESNFNFNTFVQQTGGQFFYNRNDLAQEMVQSVASGNTYYSLAYTPSPDLTSDKFHSVRIVMREPGYVAHTRQGLYPAVAVDARPQGKELAYDLYEPAVSGMTYTGIQIKIRGCAPQDGQVICHVGVELASLTFDALADGSHETTLTAAVVGLDKKDKILGAAATRVVEKIPASDTRPLNVGVVSLTVRCPAVTGATSARVIVRDATGKIGAVDLSPDELAEMQMLGMRPGDKRRSR